MALGRIALVSIKGIIGEVEKEILGVMSISLDNAIADGLLELKAYGGTEQRNLPSEYTQIQYVNMNEGSYIRVEDLPISAGYKVEFDFQTTTLGSSLRNYLGGRAADVAAGGGFRLSKLAAGGTSLNRVVFYGFETGTEYYDPTVAFQANTRYKYTYDNGACSLETGGSVISTNTFTVTDNTSTDWGINDYCSNGSWSAYHDGMYVYSLKVWNDQGQLVMDLVPAKTSTEVGFYDTVTGTLRTATGGTFTAGGDTVPTPSAPMDIVCNNGVLKARHQSGLPTGYTLLDSVTGDGLVGIDTGLKLQAGDEIDMDYEWLGSPSGQSSDRFFLGTSNADTSKGGCRAELYTISGNTAVWYVRFSSTSSVNTQTDMSTQLTGHLTLKRESFTVNNVEILTPSYAGTFQDTTLTYFGRLNPAGDTFVGAYLKVSKFTLKNNGVYRYYGIPCKNSSNVIGMYDLVSGTFSTKVGTGTFTAGNTVSDPIEVYADGEQEKIICHNKNLIDESKLLTATGWSLNGAGYYNGTFSSLSSKFSSRYPIDIPFKENTRYTLSLNGYVTANSIYAGFKYTDNTSSSVTISATTATDYTVTSTTGKTVKSVYLTYSNGATNIFYIKDMQLEEGTTKTDYVPYSYGAATAEILLKIGDYQDVQEILSGAVTRNTAVLVLTGTEAWGAGTPGTGYRKMSLPLTNVGATGSDSAGLCTHYKCEYANTVGNFYFSSNGTLQMVVASTETLSGFKQGLADLYAAGTPVIVVYSLATPTTESVTGQTMTIPAGDSTIDITQASLNTLELSAKYKALP